jgi:predicted nucleic acid-binding protein
MKSTEVCVDASLAIKVVVPEAGSDKADALFDQWAGEEIQLIAPVFFEVETDSILRQKASLRRELTADQAQSAFASLRALPIRPSIQQSKENGPGKSLASFNSRLSTTPHILRSRN